MIKSIALATFLSLCSLGNASWNAENHDYSASVSSQIANAIKNDLLVHIDQISDATDRDALEKDLKTEKDSDRQLKVIKERTAEEIFHILKIDNPKCDHNKNHMIEGDELKCLNFAWKAYVPH